MNQNSSNQPSHFEDDRQQFNDRIDELEAEVVELEGNLLNHASKLHHLALQNLHLLESESAPDAFFEFPPFPEGEGEIRCVPQSENGLILRGDTSNQLTNYLETTREQLDQLNETIEKLQLPR